MGEYYCTKCGADFDDQDGFDPNGDSWVCQECGQFFFSTNLDETKYRFPEIEWICDSCGALLNTQKGFSDFKDTWNCTECGYENCISAEHIVEERDPIDSLLHSISDIVTAFTSSREEKIIYTEIVEDDEDLEEEEPEAEDFGEYYTSDEDDSDEDDFDEDNESYNAISEQNVNYSGDESGKSTTSISRSQATNDSVTREKDIIYAKYINRKKKFKVYIFSLLGIIAIVAGLLLYYKIDEFFFGIQIGTNSDELENFEYHELEELLYAGGFKRIELTEVRDLGYFEKDKVGYVNKMTVDGNGSFRNDEEFSRFAKICIEYHEFKLIEVPISDNDAEDIYYEECATILRKAGFVDIVCSADYDIVLGLLSDVDEIESISINGDDNFDAGDRFPVNAHVEIIYHARKSDKP